MLTWTYRIIDEFGERSSFSPVGVIPGITPVMGKKLKALPTMEKVTRAMSKLKFDTCAGLPATLEPTTKEKDSLHRHWFKWARHAHDCYMRYYKLHGLQCEHQREGTLKSHDRSNSAKTVCA